MRLKWRTRSGAMDDQEEGEDGDDDYDDDDDDEDDHDDDCEHSSLKLPK